MKTKRREPTVPTERLETLRQRILAVLQQETLSAQDISRRIGIAEKEVYEHLGHVQRTTGRMDHPLVVTPAECKSCGFVFRKRERLKKPGKCPVCRGQSIEAPLFSLGQTPAARPFEEEEDG